MVEVEDRIVDFKRLKIIFSNNREVMEQVMHGLILTAHEKAPALQRYYKSENWDKAIETIGFVKSAYKHIATEDLQNKLVLLEKLLESREETEELSLAINEFVGLASIIIQDIEYYLTTS